eukprot:7769759-Pyramimonas_sp.AAC.1
MGKESRDKFLLAGQPDTLSLTRVGHMVSASPAEVDPGAKVGPALAQLAHVEPSLYPIAARPIWKPGAAPAQARTGAPSQISHLCTEPSTDVVK